MGLSCDHPRYVRVYNIHKGAYIVFDQVVIETCWSLYKSGRNSLWRWSVMCDYCGGDAGFSEWRVAGMAMFHLKVIGRLSFTNSWPRAYSQTRPKILLVFKRQKKKEKKYNNILFTPVYEINAVEISNLLFVWFLPVEFDARDLSARVVFFFLIRIILPARIQYASCLIEYFSIIHFEVLKTHNRRFPKVTMTTFKSASPCENMLLLSYYIDTLNKKIT